MRKLRYCAPLVWAVLGTLASSAHAQEDDLDVPASPAATAPTSVDAPPAASAAEPAQPVPSAKPPVPPATPPAPPATPAETDGAKPPPPKPPAPESHDLLGIAFSGYVQAQYETRQNSEDQIQQGGTPLNQDRFVVRRARLRADRAWEYAAAAIEVDAQTTRGTAVSVKRAEASVLYRGSDAPIEKSAFNPVPLEPLRSTPPLVVLTAGLTDIPFGYALGESARLRPFTERTTASNALFPGETDIGVRLWGGYSFFRYALAIQNGEPFDERMGGLPGRDLNAVKDVAGRVGVETPVGDGLRVAGGVSLLQGKGLSPGTDARKGTLLWRDLNENGSYDGGELTAVPGTAATPSRNFKRWAVGADLELAWKSALGWTRINGEFILATNLDRGLLVADPVLSGTDIRELGVWASLVQEITPYALVGARIDVYDPNSDALQSRRGKLTPSDASIRTISPIVGIQYPNRARLLFQYDFIQDHLGRDTRGVPVDLKNDAWTLRLQVSL